LDDLSSAAIHLGSKSQLPLYRGSRICSTADQETRSALTEIRMVAIDLDGVVYEGKTMVPGADAAISKLRQRGLRIAFSTNSSVRTRAETALKLRGMGIPAEEDEIVTSAYVAGLLVRDMGAKRVLVIGAEGLKQEVFRVNAAVVPEPPCDVLVVGMDTAFSYSKIQMAMDAIAGGATFIACNRDARFPSDNGRMSPGCGPIVAAVEAAVGLPAHHVAGKPNVLMLDIIAARHNLRPQEILVVGDGIESDIAMAAAFGSPSALVASRHFESDPGNPGPTCTIMSLAALPALLGGKAGS
jgi:4-nitrophenyl phosphatase